MKNFVFVMFGLGMVLTMKIYAYDDGDFQVWNTDAEELKINKDLKFALEEEFRWGNNASEFYYQHYDAGIFYSLRDWLNIGAGYRHVYELKKDEFKLENEPYVTATLLWDIKGFKFDDRNRLEYCHFDYQDDSWRYRNKVTVKLPWKFTRMEIQPYVSDEIFVGFGSTSEFSRNRFSSGLAINLTKNLKAEVYYMLQSTKSSDNWVDANVFGTKLKLAF
ncbi:MAG: DUF2490 domain-containing protein [Candidatus Omnitrophica bacterium]|nr:DUF2490 domain-containing protein [Candidatus Omnitrophota bacterium]